MAKSYLGKISALVTANTSDFNRKLDESAQRTRSFAASVKSQINAAERAASKSLDGIYTSLQKVERALSAAGGRRLSLIDDREANKIRQLVSAAEEVYRPLERAAKASEKLGADVRANFQPALIAAQKSAESLNRAIESGGAVSAASYGRVRRQVELTAEAIDRLSEAQASLGGLATGRELRFQSPGLVAALDDARREQERAARIDPRRAQQLGLGAIQGRQFIAAQRAAEANALVEDARLNVARRPDSVRFQQDLQAAVQLAREADTALEGATDELRQQVNLEERLVDSREREAQATARVVELLNKASAIERERRSGSLARQNANDFEDATAGLLEPPKSSPRSSGDLFAREQKTVQTELARTESLRSQFFALPADVQRSLEDERRAINNIANAARDGAAGLGVLELANNKMAAAIDQANQRLNEQKIEEKSFIPVGDLERSGKELKRIEDQLRAVSAASKFGTPLSEIFESTKIDSFRSKLSLLQQTLVASGNVSGPAADRVNEYAQALERAAKVKGGISAAASELAKVESAAIKAVAAVTGISPKRIIERLQRVGDVGRGAFGNLGLGIQQAIFAVEDFFSVTGGLDQQIRAAGNNISQLGFVLGGTTGLFAGVSAAITGQLIAAYIKWRNEGVSTKDRVEALNEALAQQEPLVKSLADAFASLADEIAGIGFSRQAADAAAFAKQIEQIRKEQADFNLERAAQIDPEIGRLRGVIGAREKELKAAENPGERVRLARDIQQARRGEREALDRLRLAPPASALDAAMVAVESRRNVEVQFARESERPDLEAGANLKAGQAAAAVGARIGLAKTAAEQNQVALDQLIFERSRLEKEIDEYNFRGASLLAGGDNTVRRQQLAAVEAAIVSIESGAVKAADALEIEVAKAARAAAQNIGRAQEAVADAIESGVQGAIGLQFELDGLTEALQKAQDDLTRAQKAARESGLGGDLAAAEAARQEVQRIQDAVNARQREVAAIDAARVALNNFGDVLDRAIQEVDGNINSARDAADEARRSDLRRGVVKPSGDRERADEDVRRQQELAGLARQEIAAARDRFGRQVAAADRTALAEEARANGNRAVEIARRNGFRDLANKKSYRALADRARREGDEAGALEIERVSERQRQIAQELAPTGGRFWDIVREILADAESSPAAAPAAMRAREAREISRQLETTGVLATGVRESLVARRATLEQEVIDQDPRVQAALDASTREEEQRQAAARGRNLSMTPAERAGEELARSLDDVRQFFGREAERGNGIVDRRAQEAASRRVVDEAFRATAPAIFGLAEQVQNAVVQGPSRAALQASDVTTAQGAAELNRLLRGDDSARNQNLVELQKQSNSLEELVRIARENGAPPGVLDL